MYYAGDYDRDDGLQITMQSYIELDAANALSIALRSSTHFDSNGANRRFYPAVWLYTGDNDADGIYEDLRVYLRGPSGRVGRHVDLRKQLPDVEGWWTLGITYGADGHVYDYASPSWACFQSSHKRR